MHGRAIPRHFQLFSPVGSLHLTFLSADAAVPPRPFPLIEQLFKAPLLKAPFDRLKRAGLFSGIVIARQVRAGMQACPPPRISVQRLGSIPRLDAVFSPALALSRHEIWRRLACPKHARFSARRFYFGAAGGSRQGH